MSYSLSHHSILPVHCVFHHLFCHLLHFCCSPLTLSSPVLNICLPCPVNTPLKLVFSFLVGVSSHSLLTRPLPIPNICLPCQCSAKAGLQYPCWHTSVCHICLDAQCVQCTSLPRSLNSQAIWDNKNHYMNPLADVCSRDNKKHCIIPSMCSLLSSTLSDGSSMM